MRVALDSNILAYLAGVSHNAQDDVKIERSRQLISQLGAAASLIAPAQALGELFVVLRRSGASAEDARTIVQEFSSVFGTSASEANTMVSATDLVVDHKLQFWDALIVTAACNAGCTLLVSEDMQHGFVTRGLTIVNPFRAEMHPRLAALLDLSE